MSRPNDRPTDRPNDRLDDELRIAFKREQPSADFTMRVLEQVARERAPRQSWWKKLAMLFEPPKIRWVAIGVTASLLLAIGTMQYSRMKTVTVDETTKVAKSDTVPEASNKDIAPVPGGHSPQAPMNSTTAPKRVANTSTNRRHALARHQEERELRAEGEAAKETLMLALSIASSTLSDAQKAVHDDGLKP